MDQSKKGFLHVLQGVKLSKTQNPTTTEDRERMNVIPYALAIGSIQYAMLCTRQVVCLATSLANEYNSDLGVITGQRSKLSLGTLKRTKEMFLGYGADKEFVVKSYVDANFDTNLDDSE